MTRAELKDLHAAVTELRDASHRAYKIALRNRRADGDTREAYDVLLRANSVRDRIYEAVLAAVTDGA